MPQLDKLTYLSQIFWLFLTFLALYLVVLRFVLPQIATSLKVRRRYMNEQIGRAKKSVDEKSASTSRLDSALSSTLYEVSLFIRALQLMDRKSRVNPKHEIERGIKCAEAQRAGLVITRKLLSSNND